MSRLTSSLLILSWVAFSQPKFPIGSGGGTPTFAAPFTAATTTGTITGATHNQGLHPVVELCYTISGATLTPFVDYTQGAINATGDFAVTWSGSRTGECRISSGKSGSPGAQGPQGIQGDPVLTNAGNPNAVVTGDTLGQRLIDTTTNNAWYYEGLDLWRLIVTIFEVAGNPNTVLDGACNNGTTEPGRWARDTTNTTRFSNYICGGAAAPGVPDWFAVGDATTSTAQTLSLKTLITPTIASFTNAGHSHTNAAGGGQITDAALSAAVTVAKGGTGATTLTGVLKGNGTSAVGVVAGTATDCVLVNGTSGACGTGGGGTVASNAEVDAAIIDDKYVSPLKLQRWALTNLVGGPSGCIAVTAGIPNTIEIDDAVCARYFSPFAPHPYGGGWSGSDLTAGATEVIPVPYACEIKKWWIQGTPAGSAVIDLLRSGSSIIGGGNKPTVVAATSAGFTAVSGWTSVAIANEDILTISVVSTSTFTRLKVFFTCE